MIDYVLSAKYSVLSSPFQREEKKNLYYQYFLVFEGITSVIFAEKCNKHTSIPIILKLMALMCNLTAQNSSSSAKYLHSLFELQLKEVVVNSSLSWVFLEDEISFQISDHFLVHVIVKKCLRPSDFEKK